MRPEEKIEKEFVKRCKAIGIEAYKFEKVKKGAPDRVVFLPGGEVIFFEFKVPGGDADEHQKDFIRKLTRFGFTALVVDNWQYPLSLVRTYKLKYKEVYKD